MITNRPSLLRVEQDLKHYSCNLQITWPFSQAISQISIPPFVPFNGIVDTFDMKSVQNAVGDLPPIRTVQGMVAMSDNDSAGGDTFFILVPDSGQIIPVSDMFTIGQGTPPTVAGLIRPRLSFQVPIVTLGTQLVLFRSCYQGSQWGFANLNVFTFDLPAYKTQF